MHLSCRSPFTPGSGAPAWIPVTVLLAGTVAAASAPAQSLQVLIDQAAPGDTVLVATQDYGRRITVDKPITLLAAEPGAPRLGGLSGSQATVIGLTLDGSVAPEPGTLVEAGSDLSLLDCTFRNATRGAMVLAGAERVLFDHCRFDGPIEAAGLAVGAVSAAFVSCQVTGSAVGIIGEDAFTCDGGAGRAPAERCSSGPCGRLEITACTFTGGDYQVQLFGSYVLAVTGSQLLNADTAIRAEGVRLEIEDSDIISTGGQGTGLDLASVSGFIRKSRILSWREAIVAGDGGCPAYSDLVIGGSLEDANDIGGELWSLRTTQTEPVPADVNFWGSVDCTQVGDTISGQEVGTVTDFAHLTLFTCGPSPVLPATWGSLKARYRAGGSGG